MPVPSRDVEDAAIAFPDAPSRGGIHRTDPIRG